MEWAKTRLHFYYSMRQSSIIQEGSWKQQEEEDQYAFGEKVTCGHEHGRWATGRAGVLQRTEPSGGRGSAAGRHLCRCS